ESGVERCEEAHRTPSDDRYVLDPALAAHAHLSRVEALVDRQPNVAPDGPAGKNRPGRATPASVFPPGGVKPGGVPRRPTARDGPLPAPRAAPCTAATYRGGRRIAPHRRVASRCRRAECKGSCKIWRADARSATVTLL